MFFQSNIVTQISIIVEQMPEPKQKALLKALEKDAIIEAAKQADKSVKKNNLTTDEIVAIVRDVRKKRYNAGKQIRS